MKNNKFTILILGATIILGVLAVFLAFKIFQLNQEATTSEALPTSTQPTSPATFLAEPEKPSFPQCYQPCQNNADCNLSLNGELQNGLICGSGWCLPGEICPDMVKCYHPDCPFDENCDCREAVPACHLYFQIGQDPTPTPTLTPTPGGRETPTPTLTLTPTPTSISTAGKTPTPTPIIELPLAGFKVPTIKSVLGGIFLVLTGVILLVF